MSYSAEHAVYQARCEKALREAVKLYFQPDSRVSAAAEYTLMNGGKRVRGVLVLAVCAMLGGTAAVADCFSAAIEMIHAFSLVHDDLPCMDDDDMRRGKPAAHIAYGEANALLAGDLLALEAFSVLAGAPCGPQQQAAACALLARAAGARGMIYGQELDLEHENKPADAEALRRIQVAKTGALLLASAQLGVLAAGHLPENEPAVATYAKKIGLAFQIVDDILDVESTAEVLGKPIGSDAQQGKNTFVSLNGVDSAKAEVQLLTEEAVAAVRAAYDDRAEFLCSFAQKLAARVS